MSSMVRSVAVLATLGTLVAGVVGIAGTGVARAASDCPTVNSGTGVVTPAPTPGVDWSGCDLFGASFNQVDLTNVNLAGADLENVTFGGAPMVGDNLSNADMENDDVQPNTFTDINMTGANISLDFFDPDAITGLVSGGLTDSDGAPTAMPTGWKLSNGYLVGPGDDFTPSARMGPTPTAMKAPALTTTMTYQPRRGLPLAAPAPTAGTRRRRSPGIGSTRSARSIPPGA